MASSHSETVVLSKTLDASNKPIVAVDIDEVLAPFVPLLIEFYNMYHLLEGQEPLHMEMFHNYHFRYVSLKRIEYMMDHQKVWGGTEERSKEIVNQFLESDLFINQPILDKSSFEILQKLGEKYKLVIVTSRQYKIKNQTEKLLQTYFPETFAEILLGNHYGDNGETQMSKPEMCKQLKAVLLIDDSLRYCEQCVTEKIPAILFGNYSWNKSNEPLDNNWIIRVDGWHQVEKAVETMLKQHSHIQ